jgi:hypothetical protein
MLLRSHTFRLCKGGAADVDYEDASAVDPTRGRFAVADGASEASFAGVWARVLVEGFIADAGKPWREFGWVQAAQQRWSAEVDNRPLPWYADEKRELGAFATFLGLGTRTRADGAGGVWRALAVGDACVFQTRAGALKRAFPMTRSTDFGNQPHLLCSRSPASAHYNNVRGHWRPKDRFLLMTDALAQWFLHEIERGNYPLAEISTLLHESSPDAVFPSWVESLRRQSVLRNDDVTLIVVDIESK